MHAQQNPTWFLHLIQREIRPAHVLSAEPRAVTEVAHGHPPGLSAPQSQRPGPSLATATPLPRMEQRLGCGSCTRLALDCQVLSARVRLQKQKFLWRREGVLVQPCSTTIPLLLQHPSFGPTMLYSTGTTSHMRDAAGTARRVILSLAPLPWWFCADIRWLPKIQQDRFQSSLLGEAGLKVLLQSSVLFPLCIPEMKDQQLLPLRDLLIWLGLNIQRNIPKAGMRTANL